jgi:methyl-accepting chemotaxis protein
MADEKVRVVVEAQDQASGVLGGLGKNFLGFGLAAVAGIKIASEAFQALTGFIKDTAKAAIDAANVQEDADRRLSFALKSLGGDYRTAFVEAKEFAGSLQEVTAFGDETIEGVQALLVSLGRLEGETLKRATKATIDMSAALGVDLNAAAKLVSQASQGMTGSLSRYGIVLDKNIPESEKFAEVLRVMERNFGGVSEELAGTFQGRLQQIQNLFGDILEVIGDVIIKSPELLTLLEGIKNALADTLEFLKGVDLKDAFGELVINLANVAQGALLAGQAIGFVLRPALGKTAVAIEAMSAVLAKQVEELVKPVKEIQELREEYKRLGEQLEEGIRPQLLKRYLELQEILGEGLPEAASTLKGELEEVNEELDVIGAHFEKLQEQDPAFAAIFEEAKFFSGDLSADVMQLEEDMRSLAEASAAFAESLKEAKTFSGDLPEDAKEAAKENEVFVAVVEELQFQALRLGDTFVDAAFGAEVSWGDFFKQFLKDIARAIAQALILKAITAGIGGEGGGQVGGGLLSGIPVVGGFLSGLFQTGGQVPGLRVGRDTVPAFLSPGEVIVRNPVVEEVERRLIGGEGGDDRTPIAFNFQILDSSERERIERFVEGMNDLAEFNNLRVVATDLRPA